MLKNHILQQVNRPPLKSHYVQDFESELGVGFLLLDCFMGPKRSIFKRLLWDPKNTLLNGLFS
jgi:hypothetical protein